MNSYKSKAFNAIKRLRHFKKSKASKTSQPSISVTQPLVNKIYAIDFVQAGTLRKNVTARYAGKSKRGRFMKFELLAFFTEKGFPIRLLCLDKLPSKLIALKQNLFQPLPNVA